MLQTNGRTDAPDAPPPPAPPPLNSAGDFRSRRPQDHRQMPQKTSADLANIQQACAKEYRQFSGEAAPGQWTALPLPNGMTMPTHHGNHMQQPQHHPTPGQFNSL